MFTHRPDCFGYLGILRELAGISGQTFTSPDWYLTPPNLNEPTGNLALKITNELPELVPRFMAVAIGNVSVSPSPLWLQVALAQVGARSINNIVDLTNYYMLLTGQPLHAYDYDKVKALSGPDLEIFIRRPKPGEEVSLINGKTIKPNSEAIMIATKDHLIGVGGIMGGSETEVDNNTKNIILECANFDMYATRRTSMTLGLFSDAVTRFIKGQSPLQNPAVITKVADAIVQLSGGQIASQLVDNNHIKEDVLSRASINPPVNITPDFINVRLGLSLDREEITRLLKNVEFKVEVKGQDLEIRAPFWRTDIEIKEDIVEEVGRLHGYDDLPLSLPRRSLIPVTKNKLLETKAKIRQVLSRAGANEVLTYSFVHGDLMDKVGQDKAAAFEVANALRPELQYYRLSLLPSLIDKVNANIRAGYSTMAIFEIGKSHSLSLVDKDGLPTELERVALVIAVDNKLNPPGSAYYQAKTYLNYLARDGLNFKELTPDQLKTAEAAVFEPARSAAIYDYDDKLMLGIVGEFKAKVRKNLKLPRYSAGFELDSEVLAELLARQTDYKPLPRYPKVTQDISLKLPTSVNYDKIYNLILSSLKAAIEEPTLMNLQPVDIYQSKTDKSTKHVTLRLNIASYERTLTDQEVNKLLDEVALVAKDKLSAERI
jgi:phenylalanyl-tRNA synthetase beta chain